MKRLSEDQERIRHKKRRKEKVFYKTIRSCEYLKIYLEKLKSDLKEI